MYERKPMIKQRCIHTTNNKAEQKKEIHLKDINRSVAIDNKSEA